LIFRDSQGDLDGGTLNLRYDGTTYSASLPGALAGITDGSTPAPVSVTVPLNSTIGAMNVRVWIQDRAGNSSNVLDAAFSQMSFGSKVWGSNGDDRMTGIATDASGNTYVVGYTTGSLDGELNQGNADAFVSKYDATGNRLWTRLIGTAGDDAARAVAVVGNDVYVAGETDFIEEVQGSGFLAKYDASGNIQWGGPVSISAAILATARGVAASGGHIFVAGYAKGDLNGEVAAGSEDPFLMKFDSSGTPIWTKLWGASTHDYAYGVTVDGSGNIYVVGKTYGDWDGQTSSGGTDAFISKFDGSGTRQWTRFEGDSGDDGARAAAVDGSGNIYVVGDWSRTDSDGFLAKFDPTGASLWPSPVFVSSPHCDVISAVAVDDSGSGYAVGWTSGDLDDMDNLPAQGSDDAFLVRFSTSSGDLQWTKLWGTSDRDHAISVALDSGGAIYVAGDTQGILDGYTNSGGNDLFLFKFNSAGQRQ
jgi:hypothetical protein